MEVAVVVVVAAAAAVAAAIEVAIVADGDKPILEDGAIMIVSMVSISKNSDGYIASVLLNLFVLRHFRQL